MKPKNSEAFSFQIATDNQEETDRYWHAIVGVWYRSLGSLTSGTIVPTT